MKQLMYIWLTSFLLCGCSLFEKTPQEVINGQRAVYQSILVSEASTNKIIDTYVSDCKKLITYHANFAFQVRLKEIDDWGEDDWRDKEEHKVKAEKKKDKEIKDAFIKLEQRTNNLRKQTKKHHEISIKLVSSVYNYLSTTPIELDNMEFWINKLDELSKERDN